MKKTLLSLSILVVLLCVQTSFSQEKALDIYRNKIVQLYQYYGDAKYDSAIQVLYQLQKITPYDPELFYDIALMQAHLGNYEESMSNLKQSLIMGFDFGEELDSVMKPLEKLPEYADLIPLIEKNKHPVANSKTALIIPEKDLIPEGITYDPVEECFYVGSIWKCKIIKIDKYGKISDFTNEKQDGLRKVLGMNVDAKRRELWAASIVNSYRPDLDSAEIGWSGVFKYDLTTGKLIKKYELHEKGVNHLLNDITITKSGDVFITDSEAGQVYAIFRERDTLELFIDNPDFIYPNGITISPDSKTLYMASAANGIYMINIETKECKLIPQPDNITLYGIDGLYYYNGTLLGVQNSKHKISQFKMNSDRDSVVSAEILESHNPLFSNPTTGVIVNDEFYYIANSQLRSFNANGSVWPLEDLEEIYILKAKLDGPQTHKIKLYSEIMDYKRELYIHLPKGYDYEDLKYPVMYVLDAEWHFKHTASIVDLFIENGRIPPIIVVGIPNTDRSNDFSHEPDSNMLPYTCGVDRFREFFKEEVIPFISEKYHTNDFRLIKGFCATSFMAIYVLFTNPVLFDAYITATPYVVEDYDFLIEFTESLNKDLFLSQEWLYLSKGELDRPDLNEKIPQFVNLLENKNFENLSWEFEEIPDNDHYMVELQTLINGLDFVFSDFIHPEKLFDQGIIQSVKTTDSIAEKYGFMNGLPRSMLSTLCEVLKTRELKKEANIAEILSKNDFNRDLWKKANEIHKNSTVFDAHAHPFLFGVDAHDKEYILCKRNSSSQIDYPSMIEGGADAVFMGHAYRHDLFDTILAKHENILKDIELTKQDLEECNDIAGLASSIRDILKLNKKNKKAILISLEERDYLDGKIDLLKKYYKAGVRMITLLHYGNDKIANTTEEEAGNNGLSEYGKQIIVEMNKLGMIIDITHCPDSLQLDIIRTSKDPVIASHSNARSVINIERNIPDDILRAIADKNGVVCVTFSSVYVSEDYRIKYRKAWGLYSNERSRLFGIHGTDTAAVERKLEVFLPKVLPENADIEDLINHIDHIVEIAGIDHVGIGSDYGGTRIPRGLDDISGYPLITYYLLLRGYSEEDIGKMMGGNILRIFKEVEQ